MSRFRVDHPTDPKLYADAGHDHAVGLYCEVWREGRDRPIKNLDFFTHGRAVTLTDILDFLIEFEFFTTEHLHTALAYLQDDGRRPRSKGVLRVVEMFMEMKRAVE